MPGIGEFAQGFSQSFSAARKNRTLREQLALEREESVAKREMEEKKFGLDVLQFENTLQQQQRTFGLDERRFGLESERFGFEQDIETQKLELQKEQHELSKRAQENQQNIENRRLDQEALRMWEGLEKYPKELRKAYMTHVAKLLNIDTKSDDFKVILDGLTRLDDEELSQVTGQLTSIFPSLPPGQAAAFSIGIVKGDITLPQVMEVIEQRQKVAARGGAAGGGGPPEVDMNLLLSPRSVMGADKPLSGATVQGAEGEGEEAAKPQLETAESLRRRAQEALAEARSAAARDDNEYATRREAEARELRQMAADMEAGKEFEPEEVERREAAKLTGERRAKMAQPLAPELAATLGLEGAGKISRGEAESLGIFPELVGPKEIKEIREKKASTQRMITRMDDLAMSVKGKEELLGITGSGIRFLDKMFSELKGVTNLYNRLTRGGEKSFLGSGQVRQWMEETGLAVESAKVRSQIVGLAYEMAKANDEGRLSDQDFERSMDELGAAGSVGQLRGVLDQLQERFRVDAMADIEATIGMKPLDLMTPDELVEFAHSIEDHRLMRAIIVQQKKALAREARRENGQR